MQDQDNSAPAHLYLVEIVDQGVKVGISIEPTRRIAAHSRDARAYGRRTGRTWVSAIAHTNARSNESAIKGSSRTEYLSRSFDDCLAHAQTLPMYEREESSLVDSPANKFFASLFPAYGQWLLDQESAK